MQAISVEKLSKLYRLGVINRGMLYQDIESRLALMFGRPDPHAPIEEEKEASRLDKEGHFWALRDVSFSVEEGETVGIIGRNGAGKSTLLKLLSRITIPSSGVVRLRGRIASLLEVGTGFHPDLTGRDNVYMNGAILGMNKDEVKAKFDSIVEFAEMSDFIDTPVKRYSSGMYVRLAFAVAAHLEPEILIIDEVLAVGDASFQRKCFGKMSQIANEGRTILFVSHNMSAVNRLCPRSICLDQGRIIDDGVTADIIPRYLRQGTRSEDARHEWPEGLANAGVEDFRFLSVEVQSDEGVCSNMIENHKPFFLCVRYEVRRTLPFLRVGLLLSTNDGLVVLDTFDIDDENNRGERAPGVYTARCRVPAGYLNAGAFFVSCVAGVPGHKRLASAENIIMFTVEQIAGRGVLTSRHRKGVVAPLLEWEVTHRREA